MKIGATYPQIELGGDPLALDRIGRAVEELGFDHLVMYDHVVGAVHENRNPPLWEHGPYTDKHPFHDPLVAFGYLAAITQRIELVTGILILPQRQTVLVAKQATDVDLLSGGRLRLGVGTGWNYVEYDALGQSFAARGPRLTEQIGYLRRLWAEPLVSFQGRYDSLDRAAIIPRPKCSIPIYCGGFTEPAFKRSARMADGHIFSGAIPAALMAWKRIQGLLQEFGRPISGFRAHYLMTDSRGRGLNVKETLDAAARWREAGGTHASVTTMGLGLTTADQHIAHFAEVRQRLSGTMSF
jgi:probable F420-dependent oxidoreductase